MQLAAHIPGRDNNFNLIRILAASAVLITHGFALATGSVMSEPLRERLGMSVGSIAVDVFFVVSGFLVTASLKRSRCAIEYACSRALRILPGLAVMLALTVFVLGPAMTTLPLAAYLTDMTVYRYLGYGLSLFAGVAHELPGVFEGVPFPGSVNGSLWSMPHEVRLYAGLLALWLLADLAERRWRGVFAGAILFGAACLGALAAYRWYAWGGRSVQVWLAFMFLAGASAFLLRERIQLAWVGCGVALKLMLVVAMLAPTAFPLIYLASLWYVVLCLAYLPGGPVRRYNRLGDYSFGLYIYAFPVQQTLASLAEGISVSFLNLFAWLISAALAIVSWHFVEAPALRWRQNSVGFARQALRSVGMRA